MTGIDVSTPVAGDCSSVTFAPLRADGTTVVVPTASFRIRFDRLLRPDTANRQAVCIQQSQDTITSAAGCNGIGLQPSYDPVRREVTYRLTAEGGPLIAGQKYVLTIFAAVLDTDLGIRAFDGTPLAGQLEFVFSTSAACATTPWDTGPVGDHFCAANPSCTGTTTCGRSARNILTGCAYAQCHAGNPNQAAEGMDLSSPAGLLATAIGRTAAETETGEAASTAEGNSTRFGRAMPILDPGVPGESYLLYKLLANHVLQQDLQYPFPTDGTTGDEDPPEVTRLRNEVVVGLPMPPQNASPGAFLQKGDAEWLSDWVLQGAPTTCGRH